MIYVSNYFKKFQSNKVPSILKTLVSFDWIGNKEIDKRENLKIIKISIWGSLINSSPPLGIHPMK